MQTINEERKSRLDWLLQAKQEGFEWAGAAIANFGSRGIETNRDKLESSMATALVCAFCFENTPEGAQYWGGIYTALQKDELIKSK